MLVDSHCHLNFPELIGQLDDVVKRANENGVGHMQTICTRLKEFPDILSIANKYQNIWCSVGVHPNNVEEEPDTKSDDIISLTKDNKVIGIGETGLDYYYENSPRNLQQKIFIEHIKAAQVTGLPVIVHTRSADEDTIDIISKEMKKAPFSGLIHCFSSSKWLAEEAMKLGFYISISGIVTFKKANELQDSVKELPLEKLLVETDAPYLAPIPYRGKTNEPGFTRHTAEFIANLKNVPYEQVARVTTNNFFDLFKKAS